VRVETEGTDQFTTSSTTYDSRGNVKKELLPVFSTGIGFETINESGVGNSYLYDAIGRKTSITNPLGTSYFQYNDWNQTVIDTLGNFKDLFSDARGNLVKVNEYLDSTAYDTNYSYDTQSNLIKITDAESNVKNFTYDLLGRKLSEEDLHTSNDTTFGVKTFSYDENSNLVSQTDAKNQTTNYVYDELDRLLTEDFTGEAGIEVANTYDQGAYGIGRLSSVVSQGGMKSFTYDILGRVKQSIYTLDSQDFVLSFVYDLLGNVLNMTYPDEISVTYNYNQAGLLNSVMSGSSTIVSNFDYAPTGNVSRIDFGNGVVTQNNYDIQKLYRLTNKQTTKDTSNLQNISYFYDSIGNILQINDASSTSAAKTTLYEYDDLYRLTKTTVSGSANNADYVRDYTYDIIGNMLNRTDKGAYTYAGGESATSGSTNASPHAVTQAGSTVYTYDDNGNVISDGTWSHVWDYKNRLKSSTSGTTTMKYTYGEGTNRLTKENVTTGKKTYYVDKYYDLEGETGKSHIYAGNLKLVTATGLGTIVENPACIVPTSGNWEPLADCTLSATETLQGDLIINSDILLTISANAWLNIDLNVQKVLVKNGGGILIKLGGKLGNDQ
ncbi:MAG: hypothetical protein OEL89_03895, partial [Candidatus Peregrinibacteria bacterium]|nr:hypothetical protein [Candidatus Peregrinibacteria bacterium]